MPTRIEKYHATVRLVAKTLLVMLVMAGLALPKSYSRIHEVACESADECLATAPLDLADLLPADHRPLDEWPSDCGDCGGHKHGEKDEHAPLHSHHDHNHHPDGNSDESECPHHQHHHHHQCVCTAANAWLISDSNSFSLHPPLQGHSLTPARHQFVPESPVYLLDRPPIG